MFQRLPFALQELLRLGLGFYLFVAFIALFCNWNSGARWPVLFVLLVGLIVVLALEGLAIVAITFIIKVFRDKTVSE